MPDHAITTVLLCYILSELCLEPAAKYLEGYASSHKWPVKSKGDLVVMIEELFLGADMATLAVLLHPASVQYDTAANMTRGPILCVSTACDAGNVIPRPPCTAKLTTPKIEM